MSQNVPPPPFKTKIQDEQGYLTSPWANWFQVAFQRIGGSVALSNVELQNLPTINLATIQAQVTTLKTQVGQIGSMQTSTSVPKIADATGNWQLLNGNSLTLTAGVWMLFGTVQFDNDGVSPGWLQVATMWAAANGDDTASVPAALSTATNLSVLSAQKTTGAMTLVEPGSGAGQVLELLQAQNVIVSVPTGRTAKIFLNSFCAFSGTGSDTLITAFLNATLLRLVP